MEKIYNYFIFIIVLPALYNSKLLPSVAKTPQMGWNSWNHYALNINSTVLQQTADAFINLGLDKVGYKYINIDDGWAHNKRGANGYIQIEDQKFPKGIRDLADYIHSKGLKIGIYSDAGDYTCGGQAGSLGYQENDVANYTQWSIDYLKYDNCFNEGIPSPQRYQVMAKALNASSQSFFFSLCNWGQDNTTDWAYKYGHSWRTTNDIGDDWERVISNLQGNQAVKNIYGPGIGWNDPDMLQVGNGGMSDIEYKTHFTMWAMVKAPLLIGNDVTKMTRQDQAYKILTEIEVIRINQDPKGIQANCLKGCNDWSNGLQVWMVQLEPSQGNSADTKTYAVAVMNMGKEKVVHPVLKWKEDLGLDHNVWHVRDIWGKRNEGIKRDQFGIILVQAHGVVLLRLTYAQVGDCQIEPYIDQDFVRKLCGGGIRKDEIDI